MSATLTTPLFIPADHPSLPGHFPGQPIVPGVVILDHVAQAIARRWPELHAPSGAPAIKFLAPLLPAQHAEIHLERATPDSVKFTVARDAVVCATGTFTFHSAGS